MNQLSFKTLREANLARLPLFKNKKGETMDYNNWTYSDWMTALAGEVGEAANFIKKWNRGDYTDSRLFHKQLQHELADILIYPDLLANRGGFDLAELVIGKFNETSTAQNVPIRMEADPEDISTVRIPELRIPELKEPAADWDGILKKVSELIEEGFKKYAPEQTVCGPSPDDIRSMVGEMHQDPLFHFKSRTTEIVSPGFHFIPGVVEKDNYLIVNIPHEDANCLESANGIVIRYSMYAFNTEFPDPGIGWKWEKKQNQMQNL